MGCCQSKSNKKIDATDSEFEGIIDNVNNKLKL